MGLMPNVFARRSEVAERVAEGEKGPADEEDADSGWVLGVHARVSSDVVDAAMWLSALLVCILWVDGPRSRVKEAKGEEEEGRVEVRGKEWKLLARGVVDVETVVLAALARALKSRPELLILNRLESSIWSRSVVLHLLDRACSFSSAACCFLASRHSCSRSRVPWKRRDLKSTLCEERELGSSGRGSFGRGR